MFGGYVIGMCYETVAKMRGFKLIIRELKKRYKKLQERKECVNICEIIVIGMGYIIYVYMWNLVKNVVQKKGEFD